MRVRDGEFWPTLNGVRHWVRLEGAVHRTVPLVALHGGPGGNHFVFERTAGIHLARERTVVYYEQRGCGRSDPPWPNDAYSVPLLVADVNALVDWLDVPQVDLLGYSFGGGLALEYARAHPARVRRLVLQAPVLGSEDPRIVAWQLGGFRTVARGKMAATIAGILACDLTDAGKLEAVWHAVDSPTVDAFLFQNPELAAWNRRMWRESGLINTGEMHTALSRRAPTDTRAHLAAIPMPTLMLVGRHDRNVPIAMLEDVVRELPDARLHVFEDSAHFPDIEETAVYGSVVLNFLQWTPT